MHATTTSKRLTAASMAGIVVLVALAVGASAGSHDLGSFDWPAEEKRSRADLAALGQGLHANATGLTTIGERPVTSIQLERVDETTTDVRVTEEGGEEQILRIDHEPKAEERYRHETLKVAPDDLRPGVQVRPTTDVRERDVLRLTGPPGSLQLPGDNVREKTEAFADELGFSVDTISTDADEVMSFPALHLGERACPDDAAGDCSETASVRIDCSSCELTWFNGPAGDTELDFRGSGLVLFDESSRPVAATVSYTLDLNEDALLDLDDAVSAAGDGLRQRGHTVQESPPTDTVTVEVDLAENKVAVKDVDYVWSFIVGEEDQAILDEAVVRQDAVNGNVLSVELIPEDVAEPMEEDAQAQAPAFTVHALLASLVAGLAAAGSRGRG